MTPPGAQGGGLLAENRFLETYDPPVGTQGGSYTSKIDFWSAMTPTGTQGGVLPTENRFLKRYDPPWDSGGGS